MSEEHKAIIAKGGQPWVSYAYFCGEPENIRVVNTFEKCVDKKE